MKLEYTYFSEIGTRENNEDCLRVVTVPEYNRTLFIVCDGMGGHSCGEIASEAVYKSISTYWERTPEQNDSEQKVYGATVQACSMLNNQYPKFADYMEEVDTIEDVANRLYSVEKINHM